MELSSKVKRRTAECLGCGHEPHRPRECKQALKRWTRMGDTKCLCTENSLR